MIKKKILNIDFYVLCLFLGRNAVFVGFTGFLTNVMPIVIRDFYTIIILYAVRPTVVKNFDVWYISFNIK